MTIDTIDNPQTSRNVIFDVGANFGSDGLNYAISNPNFHVYAFEPVPELISHIVKNYQQLKEKHALTNYTLITKAVSDFNGKAQFNVMKGKYFGSSSLDNVAQESVNNLYSDFTNEFKVDEKIEVEVIRLDEFCKENNISTIGFFHCDTQGHDLKVLNGMGKYKELIHKGVVEVFTNEETCTYESKDNILSNVLFEFVKWNFLIDRIDVPAMEHQNLQAIRQFNLFFKNKYPVAL